MLRFYNLKGLPNALLHRTHVAHLLGVPRILTHESPGASPLGSGPTKASDAKANMANLDRRYTYRLDVSDDSVRVTAPKLGRMVVADLSASGSGLLVSPDDMAGVTAEPATFELDSGRSFSVKLEPVRVTRQAEHLRVGARFQNLPLAGMRVLSEFLIRQFVAEKGRLERLLDDPRTLTNDSSTFIRRHLKRCLLTQGRSLRVYDHGRLLPLDVNADRFVELNGRWLIEGRCTTAGLLEGGTYTFVVALPGSVSHFASRVVHRSGEALSIELPAQLHQAGFRDSVRTLIQASHGAATVQCTHPRLCDELLDRPLLDLSARGFAFVTEPESDLLFPGDRLSFLRVNFENEVFEGRGVIRRIAPHRDSGLYLCGVEILEFSDAAQEYRWRRRVFRYLHPRAVVAEPERAAGQAWQVLAASGYVRLWTPRESQERLQAEYSRIWKEAGPGSGLLMLVERRGEAVGTLAGSILYPRTWLVHQLGITERERGGLGTLMSLTYELYSGLMYLFQHEPAADYFVIYAERDRKWSETLYEAFATQCPDQSAIAYDENRVFRRVVGAPVSAVRPLNPRLRVAAADQAALLALSRALKSRSSPVVYDALALAPADIELAGFASRCSKLGCERGRHVYVARERGLPIAALIAESGDEGSNIFGLMNRCFIVNLTREPLSTVTKAALLSKAERHFEELDKRHFIFFDEPDQDADFVRLCGFELISEGMRFIAHKRVVPAWLSYLANVLSLRQAAEGS